MCFLFAVLWFYRSERRNLSIHIFHILNLSLVNSTTLQPVSFRSFFFPPLPPFFFSIFSFINSILLIYLMVRSFWVFCFLMVFSVRRLFKVCYKTRRLNGAKLNRRRVKDLKKNWNCSLQFNVKIMHASFPPFFLVISLLARFFFFFLKTTHFHFKLNAIINISDRKWKQIATTRQK